MQDFDALTSSAALAPSRVLVVVSFRVIEGKERLVGVVEMVLMPPYRTLGWCFHPLLRSALAWRWLSKQWTLGGGYVYWYASMPLPGSAFYYVLAESFLLFAIYTW